MHTTMASFEKLKLKRVQAVEAGEACLAFITEAKDLYIWHPSGDETDEDDGALTEEAPARVPSLARQVVDVAIGWDHVSRGGHADSSALPIKLTPLNPAHPNPDLRADGRLPSLHVGRGHVRPARPRRQGRSARALCCGGARRHAGFDGRLRLELCK